ncbi:MAG: peptidoglycan editing factor PgeF [Bacillota bacterium]
MDGLNGRWTLTRRAGLLYLQCLPLLAFEGIVHGFSLRRDEAGADFDLGRAAMTGDPEVLARRRQFLAGLGLAAAKTALLEQVHGAEVAVIGPAERQAAGVEDLFVPGADGAVTKEEGIALAVRTADCAPILLLEPQSRVVAAVHAGWRSAVAGIAARAVEKMASLGADPGRVLAAIGPAIGPCCYTVGEEVADRLPGEARPTVLKREDTGGFRLDLVALNRWWLAKAGASGGNVFSAGQCTACRPDLYYSHRKEGGRTGRMMAVIARLR